MIEQYSQLTKSGFWDAMQNLPPIEKHSSLKNWEEYFLGYDMGQEIREKESHSDLSHLIKRT